MKFTAARTSVRAVDYLVSPGAGCKIPFGNTRSPEGGASRSEAGAIIVVFFGGGLLLMHPTKTTSQPSPVVFFAASYLRSVRSLALSPRRRYLWGSGARRKRIRPRKKGSQTTRCVASLRGAVSRLSEILRLTITKPQASICVPAAVSPAGT